LDRSSNHLLRSLQLARLGAYADSFEKSDVEFGVDSPVEVTAGRRYSALSLQGSKMLWSASYPLCCLTDVVFHAVHYR
jgi:hypothetical protein